MFTVFNAIEIEINGKMSDFPAREDPRRDECAAEQGRHGRREAQGPLRQLQEERCKVRQRLSSYRGCM